MAVVDAAQLNCALSGLRQSHASAGALPEDALVSDLVILRVAAETLRRDFLEPLPGFHCNGMGRARHRVCCLAAAGDAGERKVFRGVAPDDIALLPGHAENLGTRAVDVNHRLRSQVADSGLEADPPIGRDKEKPVESDSAADETAKRYTDTAHLR